MAGWPTLLESGNGSPKLGFCFRKLILRNVRLSQLHPLIRHQFGLFVSQLLFQHRNRRPVHLLGGLQLALRHVERG